MKGWRRPRGSGDDSESQQAAAVDGSPGNAAIQEEMSAAGLESFDAAIQRHRENTALIRRLIDGALAQEPSPLDAVPSQLTLLHNTAEYIEAGQITLKVMSPTHDNPRPGRGGMIAYFDERTASFRESGGAYTPGSDEGVLYQPPGRVGTESGGLLLHLWDPLRFSEGEVVDALIHETQHAAGERDPSDLPTPGVGDPNLVASTAHYSAFEDEFRAFYITPDPELGDPAAPGLAFDVKSLDASGTEQAQTVKFANERQAGVFLRLMYNAPGHSDWWDYASARPRLSYGFVPHFVVFDPVFRQFVEDTTSPVTANALNSVRIEEVLDRMQSGASQEEILRAAAAFDAADCTWLLDPRASAPFWDAARDAGGRSLVQSLRGLVVSGGHGAIDLEYDTYIVQPGDWLSRIAERYLGDLSRWEEIYNLNAEVIGPDPDLIEVGTPLRLPRA